MKSLSGVDYSSSTDTSTSTPTPIGTSRMNDYTVTALAVAPTFAAPSGTPANLNRLLVRILDNGTARALAWNAIYRSITALPTTTVAGKTTYVGFVYNSASSTWDCLAVQTQP